MRSCRKGIASQYIDVLENIFGGEVSLSKVIFVAVYIQNYTSELRYSLMKCGFFDIM